ncbi:putative Pre-mRNA-splicing factor cwf17 [Paratrimastix pyriformis]|uniref:Pre-mRNA-splicing factor cwf17 n=1 Tax=Paratrimastix pyriformis TaxID=342808 RepID=A0ABQ8UST0_9EUKA|nr:putative Pre-mRNA-splicing factor cwf17 [Paratrimastix pyriformis]
MEIEVPSNPSTAIVPSAEPGNSSKQITVSGPKRTSQLQAPTMQLTGHEAEVYCVKFHPEGKTLASAGRDKQIFIWNVYGDCENTCVCRGHAGPILDLQWSLDHTRLFSASADKTIGLWDPETGNRLKKFAGHTSYAGLGRPAQRWLLAARGGGAAVNSLSVSRHNPPILVSGGDEGHVKMWDARGRRCQLSLDAEQPVTAVALSEDGLKAYSGGIDNAIKEWDLRTGRRTMSLEGHTHSVTGLALSPDGQFLLSNAMDMTLRVWDVRPYCPTPSRNTKILVGHQHGSEQLMLRCSWSPDGSMVAAGSSDRTVNVWDGVTGRLLYKLPGHHGSVNEVAFHPSEPIIVSASNDRTLYLGELD